MQIRLSEGDKPLRVIDVLATIHSDSGNIRFKAAQGWGFHVISHTWSKGIRDLSQKIGEQVSQNLEKQQQEQRSRDAYSHAFSEADFSLDSCYQQLREFLRLLAADAVTQIWFDALCIDQTNVEEKSREIRNMGAYYSRSQGCYVLTHGVGEGYQLWGKEAPRGTELPRWFTRVWTLQEFLLPSRLIFIMEGLDQRFIALVNGLVREKSKKGLCRCFCVNWSWEEKRKLKMAVPEYLEAWAGNFKLLDDRCYYELPEDQLVVTAAHEIDVETVDPQQNLEIVSSNVVCAQCHSLPMIRKAQYTMPATNSSSICNTIYLVDRGAYLAIMECDYGMTQKHTAGPNIGGLHTAPTGPSVHALSHLLAVYKSLQGWRPSQVISEVGQRNCTVEEDRVLGILGLLSIGSGELSQLRSGKGFQAQLVELAKVCSPRILIELCGMDVKACCTVGMSWAPDFHDPTGMQNIKWSMYVRDRLQVEMERQQVTAAGSLKLLAKVVSGHVIPSTALPPPAKETEFMQSFPRYGSPLPSYFLVIPRFVDTPELGSVMLASTSTSCSFIPLTLMATNTGGVLTLHFEFHFSIGHSHRGYLELPLPIIINNDGASTAPNNNFDDLSVSFQVEMVLLGGTNPDKSGSETLKVIMVCLKNPNREELHKIGMLYLIHRLTATPGIKLDKTCVNEMMLILENTSMKECTVGGFGADLSAHVDIGHKVPVSSSGHPSSQGPPSSQIQISGLAFFFTTCFVKLVNMISSCMTWCRQLIRSRREN